MKYVRYEDAAGKMHWGILCGQSIQPMEGELFGESRPASDTVSLASVKLLAPCLPGKVVGVGANYWSHIQNKKLPAPAIPKIFFKPGTSVVGPGDPIRCPDPEDEIHFEGELGVVIGKRCSDVSKEEALSYVFGYTCVNDVTDRTMADTDVQWSRAKGLDTFCPIGPVISDEVDCLDVLVETRVDGEVRQHKSTSDMVFSVPELIAFISKDITLYPGDIIATGSPAGIGRMLPGQTAAVSIRGIGILQNTLVVKG